MAESSTIFLSGSFEGNGHIAREALMHLAPCVGVNVTHKSGAVSEIAADLIVEADYFLLVMGANDPAIQSVYGDTLVETELDFAGSHGIPVVVVLLTVPESVKTQHGEVSVELPPFASRLRERVTNQHRDRVFRLRSLPDLPVSQFDPSQLLPNPRASLVHCAYELLPLLYNLDKFKIELVQPMSRFEQGMRQLVKRFMRSVETTEHLLEMEPRAFEHFMYNLYQELGYDVELTPESQDGGRDLVVKADDCSFLIELKRWKSKRVGIKVIEKLEKAMDEGEQGAVITTSGFTDQVQLRLNKCCLGGPDDILYLVDAFRAGEIGAMMKDESLSSRIIPGRGSPAKPGDGMRGSSEEVAGQQGDAPDGASRRR